MAKAIVDIFTTQAPHQLSCEIQLLQCAVRTHQSANFVRPKFRLDVIQAIGHILKSGLPIHFLPLPALLEHWLGQAILAIQRLIRKTVTIRNPTFIDSFIFKWNNAHDLVVLDLHNQVRASGIMRTDAFSPRQFPRAGTETEGLAGERADWTNINHVARQFRIHAMANECFNCGKFATIRHAELH